MAFTSPKMKTCSRCPERGDQPIENFGLLSRSKDGRRPECRDCRSQASKVYWMGLPEEERARRIARTYELKDRRRQFVLEYLREHPCVECGESDPVVLEFDHVRGEKLADVATLVHSHRNMKELEDEIAKCEVVCANCHRRRTASRAGWYRQVA